MDCGNYRTSCGGLDSPLLCPLRNSLDPLLGGLYHPLRHGPQKVERRSDSDGRLPVVALGNSSNLRRFGGNLSPYLDLGHHAFLYVIGISLYARGEAKEDEDPSRISILFLFCTPNDCTCSPDSLEQFGSNQSIFGQSHGPGNCVDCLRLDSQDERGQKGSDWNGCIPLIGRNLRNGRGSGFLLYADVDCPHALPECICPLDAKRFAAT